MTNEIRELTDADLGTVVGGSTGAWGAIKAEAGLQYELKQLQHAIDTMGPPCTPHNQC